MSKDKRAEIVETMVRAWQSEVADCADPECEACNRAASAALDIMLKAAAGEVQRLANEWHEEWRAGHKANTHLEGKSDGADECATAILALTSEGVKE